jgi:hypothetical protein
MRQYGITLGGPTLQSRWSVVAVFYAATPQKSSWELTDEEAVVVRVQGSAEDQKDERRQEGGHEEQGLLGLHAFVAQGKH